MNVRVKLFGSLSIIAGTQSIEVELKGGDAVGKVIEKIVELYKGERIKKRIFPKDGGLGVMIILNGSQCSIDEKVKDGDEISIMPPISGG